MRLDVNNDTRQHFLNLKTLSGGNGGETAPIIAPRYMRLKDLTFDYDVIINMENWNSSAGEDLNHIICPNLKVINVKQTPNLSGAFRSLNADTLIIDKIECDANNFYSMCNGFTGTSIVVNGASNATNVDLRYAFEWCRNATKIEFNVDISSVSSCQQMFHGCYALKHIDISGLGISSTTTLTGMFADVPTDCTILVKDTATAIILKNAFPAYTFTVKAG